MPFHEMVRCPPPPSLGIKYAETIPIPEKNSGPRVVSQIYGGNAQLEGWMASAGTVTREASQG